MPSSLKKPPEVAKPLPKPFPFRIFARPQINEADSEPIIRPIVIYGCWLDAARAVKYIVPKLPVVDFGLSLGGDVTTFGSVSRMDVRDGTMKPPASVISQYR